MRVLLIALLVLVAALAGCAAEETYRVHGTFTADPRPDWDAWDAVVAKYTDEPSAILESFPEQFLVTGMTRADCNAFRAEAGALPFVASVDACMLEKETEDGDEPTSSPAS